jgi:cytochrome c-type biogenesis protein
VDHSLNLVIAFAAGVASFLSPCVLPLIPGYVSLISGLSFRELTGEGDRAAVVRKSLIHSACFVLGFSTVFTALGAFASGLGSPLAAHLPWLKKAAGALIVVFGLHTMGVLPVKWLYYQKRVALDRFRPGRLGAFLVGAAFAFGWTPCVGPILAGVLALATSEGSVPRGMLLLFVYSLGIGLPFLLTALGVGAFLRFFQTYKRFIRWGEVAAGALLVVVGVLLFTDRFASLARLLTFFNRFAY